MVPMMIHDVIFSNIFVRVAHSLYTVLHRTLLKHENILKCIHACTVGPKGCYAPIWDNKFDKDHIFVLPVGWNWHGSTCDRSERNTTLPWPDFHLTMQSGIVQNRSLGGHSPKSAFTLWQVRITIAYIFSILIEYSNNALFNPYMY